MKNLLVVLAVLLSTTCFAEPPSPATPPIPGSREITFEELIGGLSKKPSLEIVQGPKTPPTILLERDIDGDAVEALQGALDKLAAKQPKEIRIIINSDGGVLEAGFNIAQMIERFPAKVTCIVDVRAQSMASAILQSCDNRIMTSRSFLMMHQPHLTCDRCTEKQLLEMAQQMKVISNQISEQTCRKAKMKPAQWLTKTEGLDWMVSPDEALKLGFIDKVIPKVDW